MGAMEKRFDWGKFFNLPEPDDAETVYRKSTRLTIRLRYWYEMRVPFASIRYGDPNPDHWGLMLYRNRPREFMA